MIKYRLQVALVFAALALSACGSPQAPPQFLPPVAVAGQIAISEPRIRLPAVGRDQTAAYMVITNQGDKPDRLIAATSDFASTVELHAHTKSKDGMIMMRQIRDIEIPARATLSLNPGGLHLMLKGFMPDMKAGQTVPITLKFVSGAEANFMMPIVANPSLPASVKSDDGGGHKH